ncbi:MAG: glycosyltransferase [Clostridiales bacterium]|nr:glycosyltransferase [Clostridiales bacterium]
MIKVSVVIPVYNVEEYLRRCVDSVLAQTLSDLEIILVDDGSPDQSPAICDEYAQADARIRVIHKTNGGLASARNAGMRIAQGEYLFFLDSDDWLEPDGLAKLCDVAGTYRVDFVRYRAIRTGWPGLEENAPCRVEEVRELSEGLYDEARMIREVYPRLLATRQLTMGAIVGACGSLYDRSFLTRNGLWFDESVLFSEDLIFSAKVVRAAKRFYFVDAPGVYHYFYNPKSISKSFRAGRWDSCKQIIALCEAAFAQDPGYDFSDQLLYLRWFCIMLALGERRHLSSLTDKKRYCKTILSDAVAAKTPLGLGRVDVSWKQKLMMVMVKLKWAGMIARF